MDELGKSIPAAEAFVDAEAGGKGKIVNEYCLNCGTKLLDTYCHHCGQKDIPRRQTLGELWINFISSFWSYEGKFFQTTKYLITRPGYLAVEYNEGRRERYFHPARMYVFISFVFFLVYFSLPDVDDKRDPMNLNQPKKAVASDTTRHGTDGDVDGNDDDDQYYSNSDQARLDSILKRNIPGLDSTFKDSLQTKINAGKKKKGSVWSLDGSDYKTIADYDSVQAAKPESERDGWFKRRIKTRAIELNNRYKDKKESFGKDFGNAFKDNFSKVLFWLLPFFALLYKLLYIRRDYFYSEHLVFSIYYYNFFYLAGSVIMLLDLVSWMSIPVGLLQAWTYFYLLFAMKRMYKQGWGKTIVKFLVFSLVFSFFVGAALAVSALAVLMTI